MSGPLHISGRKMNQEGPSEKNLHLAHMINHQLQIISKIGEVARLIEKLSIARHDLKQLTQKTEAEIERGFQDLEKTQLQ